MALSDIGSVLTSVGLIHLLSFDRDIDGSVVLLLLSCPLAVGAIFSAFQLYRVHLMPSAEEFRRVIVATSVVIAVLVALPWWPVVSLRRLPIVVAWAGALALVLITRRMWHLRVRSARRGRTMVARTLVVGTNDEAIRVWNRLNAEDGFVPAGLVATSATSGDHPEDRPPIRGHIRDLPGLVADEAADCLFVASSAVEVEEMRLLSRVAQWTETELRVTQNLPEVLSTRLTVRPIDGVVTLSLRPVRLTGAQALSKRMVDVAVSGLALLLLLPVLLLIATAIKLTSPGPVLFRQERVTKGGRIFRMSKFRTMRTGAALLGVDPTTPFFKVLNDPRLTRVGRLLRSFSLDELPQLLNVLKGEMSLVGPRPLWAEQVAANERLLGPRHEVPAGITGWWQINGRSNIDPEEAARLDQFYIENWSLSLDLYIILRTFGAVLARRGAY